MDIYESALQKIKCDTKNCKPCAYAGPTGPTGPTERLFKSSNKIIIDSSLIIPYNEQKIIYFTIFPKKCHFFFCDYFHNKTF